MPTKHISHSYINRNKKYSKKKSRTKSKNRSTHSKSSKRKQKGGFIRSLTRFFRSSTSK